MKSRLTFCVTCGSDLNQDRSCPRCGVVPVKSTSGMNYRERWYAERGLPYEPPPIGNMQARVPERRPMREPGEDSPEDIGHDDEAMEET